MNRIFSLIIVFIITVASSRANNLQIGPVTLTTANGSQYLNFTIGWNNSWRVTSGPGNWDAVWIFVKRRDCSALDWRHVNLAAQDTAHTAGTPLFLDAYADKKGVMVYRATDGSGNIGNVNIQLKLDSVPAGNYDYQVFGIEMVYVPQGSFYVGDGVSSSTFRAGNSNNPYLVMGETAINYGNSPGNLFASQFGDAIGTIPLSFPKGFNSFYCMKYEISQGQYADFLNNIAQDAAFSRYDASKVDINRYTISGIWPLFNSNTPNRACNWISYKDLTAYLDWSALSPMTELEFEKACRGSNGNIPLAGEFAWGSVFATDADSIIIGTDGLPTESSATPIVTGSGLANFGNDLVLGPFRCGFAAKSATSRFESGATYYGIMEMSGNLWERCYAIYFSFIAVGTNFTGSHGDGELSNTPTPGFANQGWPVESFAGTGSEPLSTLLKGGGWTSVNNADLRISDRSLLSNAINGADANGRSAFLGGRGVSRRQQ